MEKNVRPNNKYLMHKMSITKMRMQGWMCGKIKKDTKKIERFLKHLEVSTIGNKIKDTYLRWFGYV